jgi:hypothetical protein
VLVAIPRELRRARSRGLPACAGDLRRVEQRNVAQRGGLVSLACVTVCWNRDMSFLHNSGPMEPSVMTDEPREVSRL